MCCVLRIGVISRAGLGRLASDDLERGGDVSVVERLHNTLPCFGRAAGEAMDAEWWWNAVGGVLQLLGILVVAVGVMQLREQLEPGTSLLSRLRRARSRGSAQARAAIAALRAIPGEVARMWRERHGGVEGSAQIIATSGLDASAQVPAPMVVQTEAEPPSTWQEAWRAMKHDFAESLARLSTDMQNQTRVAKVELEERLREIEDELLGLHSGGLNTEAWGGFLVGFGTVVATWPDWFADSVLAQAAFLGVSALGSGLWLTDADRRWWQVAKE